MKPRLFLAMLVMGLVLIPSTSTFAMDAQIVKSQKRTIVGKILIDNDFISSGESVYIVDVKTGKNIWINTLQNIRGKLKNFVVRANKNKDTVRMTGTVEYWNDGNVVLNDGKSFHYETVQVSNK